MITAYEDLLLLSTLLWPLVLIGLIVFNRSQQNLNRLLDTAALPSLLAVFFCPLETEVNLAWLLLGSAIGIDETSRTFLLFSSILWVFGSYLLRLENDKGFKLWYLITLLSSMAAILAKDIPLFFLSYAMMSLSSFGLIIYKRSLEARRAAIVYLLSVILGEMILLSAMLILVNSTGSIELDHIIDREPQNILIFLFLIGFGIKAGIPLLHMALPLSYQQMPLAAVVPLAGAVLHLALYGWIKFLPLGQVSLPFWSQTFVLIGSTSFTWGILVGLLQNDPRSLLAYSSISQMGLMTIGLGIGLYNPEHWPLILSILLLYALHHSLLKGNLFIGLGLNMQSRYFLIFPALIFAGLPFFGGAIVKTLLKEQTHFLPEIWSSFTVLFFALSSVGTGLLMARFLYLAFKQQPYDTLVKPLPFFLLLALSIFITWFWPLELERHSSVWGATWPILLVVVICWITYHPPLNRYLHKLPSIPPGDIIILLEKLWPCKNQELDDSSHSEHHLKDDLTPQNNRLEVIISNIEQYIGHWQIALTLFMMLVIVLFGLLVLV